MHIHRDVGASAVAITVGLGTLNDSHPIYAWKERVAGGFVELYAEIGALAALSNELSDRIGNCIEFHHDGFPGVYAYEVDEALGASLVELLADSTEPMTGPKVKAKLGELALAFFKQVDKPIPITREVIKVMTGYVEPGYVEPEPTKVTIRLTIDVTYELNGTPVNTMAHMLATVPHIISGDGMLSGHLAAVVDNWDHKVEVIATE